MDYLEDFPQEAVAVIEDFISRLKENSPDFFGSNVVIRDDIFSILEKTATVVFFPLEDEENDGFHIKRTVNGTPEDFVFINTAKAVEKQVFTAAHELGHRLGIEHKVSKTCSLDINKYGESIVNRFAAMLLLPERVFRQEVSKKLSELSKQESKQSDKKSISISLEDAFRLIVYLMDYFFVPFKTIVYRLREINAIPKETENKLLDVFSIEMLDNCIKEGKYLRLNKPNLKKSIAGYSELLEKAEKSEAVPIQKVKKIRELFEIPEKLANDTINLTVTIKE